MVTDPEKGTLIEELTIMDIHDITKFKIEEDKLYYNDWSLPVIITKSENLQLWTRGYTLVSQEKALIKKFLSVIHSTSIVYCNERRSEIDLYYYKVLLPSGNLN